MDRENVKSQVRFPPPREMTEQIARQIVEESIRARREFEQLTRPMEIIEPKDLQVRAR